MRQAVGDQTDGQLAFRVTLIDGRVFAVARMMTHVAKGRCEMVPNRWATVEGELPESEPVCSVITGYMLVGAGQDKLPTTLAVPPTSIESVECVLVGPMEEPEPFGFARALQREGRPALEEVEEPPPVSAGKRPAISD
jgi:hypothetical protein